MVFFINYLLGGNVIDTSSISTVVLSAFALTVGSLLLMYLGEMITEKGIGNGISFLIFASIVSGMVQQISTSVAGAASARGIAAFMLVVVLVLYCSLYSSSSHKRTYLSSMLDKVKYKKHPHFLFH